MATEKLEIQVSANVQNAVAGMEKLNKAVAKTATELPKLNKATGQSTQTLTNFSRVVQDAPFGIIGIANNIDPLISSFQSLSKSTGGAFGAFKALASSLAGPAGIALAISVVTSALIKFGPEIDKAILGADNFGKAIDEASEGAAKDAIKVNVLTEAIKSGTLSTKQQTLAQNELIKINPEFKGAFEGGAVSVDKLDKALKNTNQRLLEQIKISAATNVLQKEFEKLAATVAKGGDTNFLEKVGSLFKGLAIQPATGLGFGIAETVKRTENLIEAQNKIEDFGKRINEVFKAIGVSFGSFVEEIDPVKTKTEKLSTSLKQQETNFINLNEAAKKYRATLIEINNDPTIINAPRQTNPINVNRADRTSSLVITPEALRLQGQYSLQLDEVLEKLRAQQELVKSISDTITGGLNAGIDQFFNAIANNQDPFEALAQSVKRLVAELAAAVVKALILKAVTAAFTGGTSAGAGAFSGLFGSSVVRGDQLRLLTFLRG